VKEAADEERARVLLREAEVLEAARHPGVVELVGVDDHAGRPALVTTLVDGADLASRPAMAVAQASAVLAGVASTLADLHDVGVVHGAVAPEHVLVTVDGRPVLCGLGHGGRAGHPPVAAAPLPEGFADPARSATEPLSPATDVFGVGALVQWAIQRDPTVKPGRALLKLRAIAARATAADPLRRPTARDLASDLAAEVPAGRSRARPPWARAAPRSGGSRARAAPQSGGSRARAAPQSGGRRARRGERSVRRAALVAAGAVLATGALVAAVQFLAPNRQAASPRLVPPATPATLEAAEPEPQPGPPPAASAPRPDCPRPAGLLSADVDSDGCADNLRYADGVLEGGEARWAVGRAGDQVATGDWRCTGAATLVLLRPSSGEVFLFDGWAPPGRDLVAGVIGRVEGAFALRPADLDGDRCPELMVERRGGPPETVLLR
jgi:hypothetical protein